MMRSNPKRALAVGALALAALGCASSDDAAAPGAVTISITAAGVSPASVSVATGGSVTFLNNDSAIHEMSSDPHPTHTDCPGLNAPPLGTGEQFSGTAGAAARLCGYHDHLDPDNAALRGTIEVVASPSSGNGSSGGGY